tara:strand:- start:118 stop:465 length:348 start_codon:yes stop_codon:yes gene_type:complete
MDEALTVSQRLKRSRIMKMKAPIIARKREIALNKRATPEKIFQRSMKKARDIMRRKVTAGKSQDELSFSQKEKVEKLLSKKKGIIKRIAKKLLPQMKASEVERLKKRRENKGKQK